MAEAKDMRIPAELMKHSGMLIPRDSLIAGYHNFPRMFPVNIIPAVRAHNPAFYLRNVLAATYTPTSTSPQPTPIITPAIKSSRFVPRRHREERIRLPPIRIFTSPVINCFFLLFSCVFICPFPPQFLLPSCDFCRIPFLKPYRKDSHKNW